MIKKIRFLLLILSIAFNSAFSQNLPDSIQIVVSVSQETQTLQLYKANARGKDFKVYTYDNGNYTLVTPTPEVRTYRGTVAENPNAIVFASIDLGGTLRAKCIDMEAGHGFYWSITKNVSNQISSTNTISPPSKPSQNLGWPRNGSNGPPNVGIKVPSGVSSNGIEYGKMVDFDFAIDITNATYNSYGSDISSLLANYELEAMVYDMFLSRDALIRLNVPVIVIRQTTFYSNPSAPNLGDMSNAWNSSPLDSTGWDMVWASEGWYAGSIFSAGALYHENGHSWGAQHLVYMGDIMGGNKPNHGPITTDKVRKQRTNRINNGMLLQGEKYPFPIHPHTNVDVVRTEKNKPVSIDVLANDWDVNGDTLVISSWSDTTENNGLVTLNSDGTLLYTPSNGFVGKDIIAYTVSDQSAMNLKTKDLVHVEVVNNDLHVHYTYNQSSGNNITDQSGYGNHGELNGSSFQTHSIPGPLGNALRVHGMQNENQIENAEWSGLLVGIGDVMPVDLHSDRNRSPFEIEYNRHSGYADIMDGDYTFATWFMFDDYDSENWNSWGHYIASKWWHMESSVGWDLRASDGKLTLHWRIFDGATDINTLEANVNLEEGAWYHAAAVFDRSKNEARIYLNGELVATRKNAFKANGFIFNGRAPLCLGAFSSEQGYLDDTRIYTRDLSGKEVKQLYQLPGDSAFFLTDTITENITSTAFYRRNLESLLFNSGDYSMQFGSSSLPNWLTLTPSGQLVGSPGVKNNGQVSFTVFTINHFGDTLRCYFKLNIGTFGLTHDYWHNVKGTKLSDLKGLSSFPNNPSISYQLDSLEFPINYGNSYGSRAYGYLIPSISDTFTFKISGDDQSELWLSNDQSDSNKIKIAEVPYWSDYREFSKYKVQTSTAIPLVAGKRYFIEALLKESSGADHLSVTWESPSLTQEIIPGLNLEAAVNPSSRDTIDFTRDTIDLGSAIYNEHFISSIKDSAQSSANHTIEFTLLTGPEWLNLAKRGKITAYPTKSNRGIHYFKVLANDVYGATSEAFIRLEVTDKLLAHWTFNDTNAKGLIDVTGNGFNGIISGKVFYSTGILDGAYDFKNNGSFGELKKIPVLPNNWSVSAILKRRETPNYSHLVTGSNNSLRIEQYNNTNKLGVTRNGLADWTINYACPKDTWTHIVFTKSDDSIFIYVDTLLKGCIVHDLTLDIEYICKFFNGEIDDLELYGAALSASEIGDLYLSKFYPNTFSIDSVIACGSHTWIDGNTYYRSTDSVKKIFSLPNGNDSIVYLHLIIPEFDPTLTLTNQTLNAISGYTAYQWYRCDPSGDILLNGEVFDSLLVKQNGEYRAILFDQNCSDTTDCIEVNILSQKEFSARNFEIYPNPSSGLFRLKAYKDARPSHIEVVDDLGRIRFHIPWPEEANDIQINLENLASGSYIIQIYSSVLTENKKILKY